jgi:gliding motility-associated-like protein
LHSDGSIYVIGTFAGTNAFDGGQSLGLSALILNDIFLAKYTPAGDLLWVKKFIESVDPNESAGISVFDFKVDHSGDIVIHGHCHRAIRFLGDATRQTGGFIAKIDSECNLRWIKFDPAKSIAELFAHESGSHIAIDQDNNVFWYSSEQKNDLATLELTKYNSDGIKIWSKSVVEAIDVKTAFPAVATTVAMDSAGNFILSGSFQEEIHIGNKHFRNNSSGFERRQLFVCKLTSNGDFLWAMQSDFGSTGGYTTSHTIDSAGNVYLTAVLGTGGKLISQAETFINSGPECVVVVKLGPDGDIIWAKLFPEFYSYDVVLAKDYLYVTGLTAPLRPYPWTNSDARTQVLKIDRDGITYASLTNNLLGYPSITSAYQSVVDSEENIYTVGNFGKSIKFGCLPTATSGYSFFLVKHKMNNEMTIAGPESVCDTETLTLQAFPVKSGVTYHWHLPDGVTPVSGTTETATNSIVLNVSARANRQSIFVTTSDQCPGYLMNPYVLNIFTLPAPPKFIVAPAQVCSGMSESFEVKKDSNVEQWIWTPPADVVVDVGNEANLAQLTFPEDLVQGIVTVTARNRCGESNGLLEIHAYAKPSKPKLVTASSQICSPGSAIFSMQKDAGTGQFIWTVPAEVTANLNDDTNEARLVVTKTFLHGTIKVAATNLCGDSNDTTFALTAYANPSKPILSGPAEICSSHGTSVKYQVEQDLNTSAISWDIPEFFSPNGKFSSSNNIQLTVMGEGADTIKVYGVNVCSEAGEPATIFVESFQKLPKPVLEVDPCKSILTVTNADQPRWYKNDMLIEGMQNQFTVLDSGSYYAEVSNFCGTQKSQPIAVYPVDDNKLLIPNVITPNRDGKNDSFQLDKLLAGSSVHIFNRWGNAIFYAENYKNDWSPTYISPATYYYVVHSRCRTYRGWVSVIK